MWGIFKHQDDLYEIILNEISTEINIFANAHKVWQVLTDFKNYAKWNPFVREIEGMPSVGNKLKIHLHTSKGKDRTYSPKVTKVETDSELRWYGKAVIPGIFDGERIFKLEVISNDETKFIHKEIFSGILVDLVGNRLDKDMYDSFNEMNKSLKTRVEE